MKAIPILMLLFCAASVHAQQITGKITDHRRQPVVGATVVLQTVDSTYVNATVSNADGIFVFDDMPGEYRLVIQHLTYRTKQIEAHGEDAGVIELESEDFALDAVVVTAERPFIKVENGRLGYDLSLLGGTAVVNNAYEALAKLPGVEEKQGVLRLTGAGDMTVILNGKPTTMDAGQLETLLRNTPLERVEKAEVIYSAPPEYHVRGAVINVILKRPAERSFQGEISGDYKAQYFNGGAVNGNFRLSTPKTALDIMYRAEKRQQMEYMVLDSRHTLNDQIHNIVQNEQLRSKYWNHNFRGAFEYNINDKSTFDIAYTGSITPNQLNTSHTTGNYQTANINKEIVTRMHNLALRYHSGFGLEIGGEYTHYTSDNEQLMHTDLHDGSKSRFSMTGGQRIDRYSVYADQKHALPKNWNVGYGASFRFAQDRDFQLYEQITGSIQPQNTNSHLKEQVADLYISLSKNFAPGTSLSVSATGEYYTIGSYHKWAIYPQASLTWDRSPKHLFQLSLSTDKTYPGYWDMQSSVTYLNGYTELWGTPGLRPMTTYNLNGTYILKRKYIFSLFFTHTSDHFAQTAYQTTDRMALIYKNTNWNYMRLWGGSVVLPFKAGAWLDTRLTFTGMQMHQRCDDFFDIPFNRKKWTFGASLDNTFKIHRNLAFELLGSVQTPVIQGTFDVGSILNLTAGLKWSFAKDRMSLSARCSDLFNTGMPKLKVRFKGQHLNMNSGFYSRTVSLRLGYRFGGYKHKEVKKVDTSRFGH